MTKAKRILTIILLLALVITIGGELFLALSVRTSAYFTKDTGVLEDLMCDTSFNPSDYPDNANDYSLNVIQLAEGETGDIYIYVYQPAAKTKQIVATAINISDTGTAVGLRKCDLSLVDSSGVFQKYKVENMTRPIELIRRYFIVCMYRPWDKALGDSIDDAGTIGVGKALPVETIWTAETMKDGSVVYSAEYSEDVISVTSSCLGYFLYESGMFFASSEIRSHYFAFSTNKPIDALLEAYVEYEYYHYYNVQGVRKEDSGTKAVTLNREQVFEINDSNFFTQSYKHKRIQSTSDFLKEEGVSLSDDATESIASQQWILRYLETDHFFQTTTNAYGLPEIHQFYTTVNGVTIFRLKYDYQGKIYDVGVISDILKSDDIEDGYIEQQEWWEKIMATLMIILICVLVLALWGPLKLILGLLWTGLKFLFSILWTGLKYALWFVKIPFNIIGWLFKTK